MRGWFVFVLLLAIATPAAAQSVWNVKVAARGGGSTHLRTIEANPNVLLPACRCVTGIWTLADDGESKTHFTGTLAAPVFNHPRKAPRSLRVKIRKTRALMGVHRDHRATIHGVVRGSGGQLVLREVSGGEWEVAGVLDAPADDLWANGTWRVARAPKPARASPIVDAKADASALADLINDYRATLDLPRVPLSAAMTKVAQAHVKDLNENKPNGGGCNMHSWSKQGSWSACCYDGSAAAARCMWKKPKEIAGYKGHGYEIAANASGITPAHALELWKKSASHHAVMINEGKWSKPWKAMGVAVEGDYAVAWFGEEPDKSPTR